MPKARKVCGGCGSKRPRHTRGGERWCRRCWDAQRPKIQINIYGEVFGRANVLALIDQINAVLDAAGA
jgi:hypothetical protein